MHLLWPWPLFHRARRGSYCHVPGLQTNGAQALCHLGMVCDAVKGHPSLWQPHDVKPGQHGVRFLSGKSRRVLSATANHKIWPCCELNQKPWYTLECPGQEQAARLPHQILSRRQRARPPATIGPTFTSHFLKDKDAICLRDHELPKTNASFTYRTTYLAEWSKALWCKFFDRQAKHTQSCC